MQDFAETERDGTSPKMLAVLIDADNISYQHAPRIFHIIRELAGRLGVEKPVCKAYGNLNSFSGDRSWRKGIDEYGVEACPQISLLEQKNVADIALILDAMELWASGGCAGMVIVSSDSDFIFLVRRLRDRGMRVYVIGNSCSVLSLRRSCERFFELPPLSSMVAIPEQVAIGESEEQVREVVAEPCPVSPVMPQEETVASSAPSTVTQPTPYRRMVMLLQELRCESLSTLQHTIMTQWSKPQEEVDRITRAMARDGFIRIDAGTGHVDWLDKVYEGKAEKVPSVTVLPQVTCTDLESMPKKPADVTPAERKRLIDLMRQNRCKDLSACRNCLPHDRRQWLAYLIQIMMCQKLIVFDKASGAITWN